MAMSSQVTFDLGIVKRWNVGGSAERQGITRGSPHRAGRCGPHRLWKVMLLGRDHLNRRINKRAWTSGLSPERLCTVQMLLKLGILSNAPHCALLKAMSVDRTGGEYY